MAKQRDIKAGGAFVELSVRDKLVAGLKKAAARMKAFGESVRKVGQNLVRIGVTAATPLAAASVVFANFEQRMARVQALTGASREQFERLSAQAKRLGEQTVFSASQAAEAMAFFALAGYQVDQILAAMEPTLNLAAAGELQIAQAADIAAKIMAGMGIEADNLGYAMDVLTKAMTTANTDLLQLGDAMKFVGPIAKSAGVRFEEIVAAIQLLSNAGIQGEMAGTTLRGALLSLTSPSKEATDQLTQLGVRVSDVAGNVRPLADIIQDLERAMEGMGTGQRLEILGRIFDARQAAGVAELLGQGSERLREFTAALESSGGTAERIARVQLNTLRGSFVIMTSALEGLAIAIGEALVGPLRAGITQITRGIEALTQWVRANRELVALAGISTLAVIGLGGAFVALGVAIKVAAFAAGTAATVLGAVLSPIGLVVISLGVLTVRLNQTSSIGGAALTSLAGQFEKLKEIAVNAFGAIADALNAGDVELAAEILWTSLRLAWLTGTESLSRLWSEFRAEFVQVSVAAFYGALEIWARVQSALESMWVRAAETFKSIWRGAVSYATGLFESYYQRRQKAEVNALVESGKISAAEGERRKRFIDEQFDQQRGIRQREDIQAESDAQSQRDERLRGIEQEKQRTIDALRRAESDLSAAATANAEQETRALRQRIADLRAQLEAMRVRAADTSSDPDEQGSSARARMQSLRDQVEEFSVSAGGGGLSARGTFNAAAVQGLQGGAVVNKLEEIKQELVRIRVRAPATVA